MKYILIITSLLFWSCNAQNKKEKIKKNKITTVNTHAEMTTENFDITLFKKNNINNTYSFKLNDGSLVTQESDEGYYYETITPVPPKLFIKEKRFYESGLLESILVKFPNNFLINLVEYNNEGKLINEMNYDIPFKFNFEKLLLLIKNEKDSIDISDRRNTTIGRSSDENGTFWYITYKKVPMRREVIKVDGITGEILERGFHPHEDN